METNRHDHVDLVTLEEVQRLLADTDFATIDDLKSVGGLGSLAGALDPAGKPAAAAPVVTSLDGNEPPLPRRR